MKDNLKLTEIISGEKSSWKEKAKFRINNKSWLERSANIALRLLKYLKENEISQKRFAEMIEVSPQYVSKILKGSENLSLETISKIELALNITLINVVIDDNNIYFAKDAFIFEQSKNESLVLTN